MSDRILQEILLEQDQTGWRMIVGCILLNQTTRQAVDRVWPVLFERFPGPSHMGLAKPEEIAEILQTLGLQNRRAKSIRQFSLEWNRAVLRGTQQKEVLEMTFTGVGEYARDSWIVFVEHDRERYPHENWPGDKELRAFLGLERLEAA